jgi:hypothetical protein
METGSEGSNNDGSASIRIELRSVQCLVLNPRQDSIYDLVQWFLNTLGWKMMKILSRSFC